jgi:hypothetical protein
MYPPGRARSRNTYQSTEVIPVRMAAVAQYVEFGCCYDTQSDYYSTYLDRIV